MSEFFKKIFILTVIFLFIIAFSTSYNSLNIDNLAYVTAIGIDTSDENNLKVSFQFSSPAKSSDSGKSETAPSFINTVDASSISNAVNLMNVYLGKELNLSHCKIIIFSEEIAERGISSEIYTLISDIQIRPSANIVISKCDAKSYIENSKPSLENLVTTYYEIFPNSSKYTGYSSSNTIGEFFNSLICSTCEPTAILGGLNTEPVNYSTDLSSQKDSTIIANSSSIEGKRGSENIGLAVFKGDTFIGELNAIETVCFLNMHNKIDGFLISVPYPEKANTYLDIYLTPDKSTNIDVSIINDSPYIKIKAKFSGIIQSVTNDSNYLDSNLLDSISSNCNRYLESTFLDYLYKTSIDFKSDINAIGKFASSEFFTIQEFENYNWLENYQNASFEVNIDTSIESGSLISET